MTMSQDDAPRAYVLKAHRTPASRRCFEPSATPVRDETGKQTGWQCVGCKTRFSLESERVRVPWRPRR